MPSAWTVGTPSGDRRESAQAAGVSVSHTTVTDCLVSSCRYGPRVRVAANTGEVGSHDSASPSSTERKGRWAGARRPLQVLMQLRCRASGGCSRALLCHGVSNRHATARTVAPRSSAESYAGSGRNAVCRPSRRVPSFTLTARSLPTYRVASGHGSKAGRLGREPRARVAGPGSFPGAGGRRSRHRRDQPPLRPRCEELLERATERAELVHGPRAGGER